MKIDGSIEVAAEQQGWWDLLQDPEFLKEIMPGCKEMRKISEDEFEGSIGAKVGAIASQYTARFTVHDMNPPHSYSLKMEGKGKGGFVSGDTKVELLPVENGTELRYEGEVSMGGTIARIGQRLVDAAAKMLLKQGFNALKKKVEERTRDS